MAKPHHHTAPRRSSGDGVRSARCSICPAPVAYRLPPALLTNCTPQPAPGCVAEPKSLPTACVLVAACESQHSLHQLSPHALLLSAQPLQPPPVSCAAPRRPMTVAPSALTRAGAGVCTGVRRHFHRGTRR
eukprot:1045363-Prymnesium_polylepis.2